MTKITIAPLYGPLQNYVACFGFLEGRRLVAGLGLNNRKGEQQLQPAQSTSLSPAALSGRLPATLFPHLRFYSCMICQRPCWFMPDGQCRM